MTKGSCHPAERLRQLSRVLLIIELLSPLRYGASLGDLTDDVCELLGESYCERTIRRDMEALEKCGVVERVKEPGRAKCDGGEQHKWCWISSSPRAAAFEQIAIDVSLRREERALAAAGQWAADASTAGAL